MTPDQRELIQSELDRYILVNEWTDENTNAMIDRIEQILAPTGGEDAEMDEKVLNELAEEFEGKVKQFVLKGFKIGAKKIGKEYRIASAKIGKLESDLAAARAENEKNKAKWIDDKEIKTYVINNYQMSREKSYFIDVAKWMRSQVFPNQKDETK